MKYILAFLKTLQKNNNREWFEAHKDSYLVLKEEFSGVVKRLIDDVTRFEPEAEGLRPGDCIFRINRDIRFSNDKRPYKENFGAYIAPGGKKSEKGGYYIHLQPGNESMVAGGIYMPTPEMLKMLRQEIDYNPDPLLSIMKSKSFRLYFKEIVGEKLKRIPHGYPEDHPNADLLKFKGYIVVRGFKDTEVIQPKFYSEVVKTFKAIKPFNDYLNAVAEG
jgi:uncharacterized protein (TIGR02453 family)